MDLNLSTLLGIAGTTFFAWRAYSDYQKAQVEPFVEAKQIYEGAAQTNALIAVGIGALTAYSWNDPYRLNRALRGSR